MNQPQSELLKTAFVQNYAKYLKQGYDPIMGAATGLKNIITSTPKAISNAYQGFKGTLSNSVTDEQAKNLRQAKTVGLYAGLPLLGAKAGLAVRKKTEADREAQLEKVEQIKNLYSQNL